MIDQVISVPHFTPTFSEALEAEWYASLGNLRKGSISIGIVILIMAFVTFAHRDDAWMVSFFTELIVILASVYAIWFALALAIAARRISKHSDVGGCSGYSFSAEGVDIANNVTSIHMSWAALHDFHRSRRLLMFRPRESKALFFIPVRCLDERDREPLERLLSECLPSAK